MAISFKSESYGKFFGVSDGLLTNFSSLTDDDFGMTYDHDVSVNSAPPVSDTAVYTLTYQQLQSVSRLGYININYNGQALLHTGGYSSSSGYTFTIDLDDGTNNLELIKHTGGMSQSGSNTSSPQHWVRGTAFVTINLSDLTIVSNYGSFATDVSGISISGGGISNATTSIANNTSFSAFDLSETNLIVTSAISAASSSSASTSSTDADGIFSIFGGKK